jgi:hypothetical protein
MREAFSMADDKPETDNYSDLSNDELYEILCKALPHMYRFSVNDLTRETAIAMLKVEAVSKLP